MDELIIRQGEITCGATDLLTGIVIIPMIIVMLCTRTQNIKLKKLWVIFFAFFSVASIMGFLAHYVCTDERAFEIIWIPLYPIIFEVINTFWLVALALYKNDYPTKKQVLLVHLISLAGYIVCQVLYRTCFTTYNDGIILLAAFNVLYALVALTYVLRSAAGRQKSAERLLLYSMIPLIIGVVFQFWRDAGITLIWYFNCDGITHLFMLAGLITVFTAALKTVKRRRDNC